MAPVEVPVALGSRSYPIIIGENLLENATPVVTRMRNSQAIIVTNDVVGPLYRDRFGACLTGAGCDVEIITLPDGEAHKTLSTLGQILDRLMAMRAERKSTLIALGGGVIGDITGFAAAIYQRGMSFIQIPTTLLAQVDSAVGGKTAVNHPLGKNMIGAFYQPQLVLADTSVLATLPDRELRAGIAEVIKYGLINDAAFFRWLVENMNSLLARDPVALAHAIKVSCENKSRVVAGDEREEGARALLNLGHTFGHAIEAGLGFGTWLHGEAVAAGMMIAVRISRRLDLLNDKDVDAIESLLHAAGLPIRGPRLGFERYYDLMCHDKKVDGGQIRFVLLKGIGNAFITKDVPPEALRIVLEGEGVDDC